MAVAARINPTWKWKWIAVSTAMILYGFRCVYDYNVAYPKHDEMVTKFHEFKELGTLDKWPAFAAEHGYGPEDPGQKHLLKNDAGDVMKDDYFSQIWQAALVFTLGVAGYGWLAFNMSRKLVADDDKLIGPGGAAPYSAITSIDKKRWDRKGIAVVHYTDAKGEEDTITIDDWIYRDADLVLEEVEARTGIVGDELPTDG
jgi:hypothetical protein